MRAYQGSGCPNGNAGLNSGSGCRGSRRPAGLELRKPLRDRVVRWARGRRRGGYRSGQRERGGLQGIPQRELVQQKAVHRAALRGVGPKLLQPAVRMCSGMRISRVDGLWQPSHPGGLHRQAGRMACLVHAAQRGGPQQGQQQPGQRQDTARTPCAALPRRPRAPEHRMRGMRLLARCGHQGHGREVEKIRQSVGLARPRQAMPKAMAMAMTRKITSQTPPRSRGNTGRRGRCAAR